MTALRWPVRSSDSAIQCEHDVLPFVPVTPIIHIACDGLP